MASVSIFDFNLIWAEVAKLLTCLKFKGIKAHGKNDIRVILLLVHQLLHSCQIPSHEIA